MTFVICVALVSAICPKWRSSVNLNPEPMKSHHTSNVRRELRLVVICSFFFFSFFFSCFLKLFLVQLVWLVAYGRSC